MANFQIQVKTGDYAVCTPFIVTAASSEDAVTQAKDLKPLLNNSVCKFTATQV